MLLYGHPLSGNTHKVRLLLGFLGLPYEERTIDIPGGEGSSDSFTSLNPLGQVPTLVDGERVIRDAQAILIYLAGRSGEGLWWPEAPLQQALVAQWLSFAANEIHHGPNLARLHFLLGVPVDLPAAQNVARRTMMLLNDQLTHRDWLETDHATIADCACAPYAALSSEGGVPTSDYPAVIVWLDRLKALPGFVAMPGFG